MRNVLPNHLALAAVLFSATACELESDRFVFTDPSCGEQVPELARSLTYHLVQTGDDGTFDYAPVGSVISNVAGSYDLLTGDFSWTETGTEHSWIEEVAVEGYGYAQRNGDLDLIGTRSTTDILDVVEEQQFRIERTGCFTNNRVRTGFSSIVRETVEAGVFSNTSYAYSRQTDIDGSIYYVDGELFLDRDFVEEIAFEQDEYSLVAEVTGNRNLGTRSRTYAEVYSDGSTRDGVEERATDGSRTVDFTQVTNQGTTRWEYEVDYAGNGAGIVSGQGFTCDLTFRNGQCSYDCGSSQGAC